jgi:hypothetical protein
MMQQSDSPKPENGKMKADNDCPFYELGTADFHEFRKEVVSELQRLNDTLGGLTSMLVDRISNGKMVPVRTHIITIVAVIVALIGSKLALEFLEHLHVLI